ncbi:MAG: heterodisulfide reductase-related iron-sulfur binding cluster [Gammaproteobacteria bacterium]|nr:heterodisulfide reductase-related iron-sulfur binding cluster [Gammaproteobacteria bacterium]MDH5802507.1 heterodisulfide reductase-related iron-sulfur binding cluster [Gammaproteobacteria bacterium]
MREGSLEAPIRHPIPWHTSEYYDEGALFKELERVYDICHGCRRCFNLCHAFPTLFDLVDESESMEVDGVDKQDFWKVVDHCYLCDMCYMSKCPYVPPHEWNLDFPHLMLRAKAVRYKAKGVSFRDRMLAATDRMGRLLSNPVLAPLVNLANKIPFMRSLTQALLGVHVGAVLPPYASKRFSTMAKTLRTRVEQQAAEVQRKVVLFTTCYANYNKPELAQDLVRVFKHNDVAVTVEYEQCCGMPSLELGDLAAVQKAKDANLKKLLLWVEQGWDIVAPVPSCVLMFKQELPLMFPEDADLAIVSRAVYDPFEYLMRLHGDNQLKTDFKKKLGKIAYHSACHLRVQNMGWKTKQVLELVQGTHVELIERCSGHDGTYAVKVEFHKTSKKLCKPVVNKVKGLKPDFYSSDCPMAGDHISNGLDNGSKAAHPLTLLRRAYGMKSSDPI